MAHGEIFLDQMRRARQLDLGILTMPAYEQQRLSSEALNQTTWLRFKEAMSPFGMVRFDTDDEAEFILTPKTMGWGIEDANIFVGHADRQIQELTDLSPQEGAHFLELCYTLARGVIARQHTPQSQISIGFNPNDLSISHHSLLRLHAHVRAAPHPLDLKRRTVYQWSELDRFDRMAFVEPFSVLHHDFLQALTARGLFEGLIDRPLESGVGYTTFSLSPEADFLELFVSLSTAYAAMRKEYEMIAQIFTDGRKDTTLDRFIPRDITERRHLLAAFLESHGSIYSARSQQLLSYLSEHIDHAQPRDADNPRDMSSNGKLYITRGFAGALTFHFDRDSDAVKMDFLPRVVTTSGVTKTIMGDRLPTVIAKTRSEATAEEHAITKDYHQELMRILHEKLPAQVMDIR